ncbi:hypothetical protein [Vibrio barjaei]|uniref:hypothetical protein n=1 Tax=Vibrio barjaei TaxID=1676683 RepID=UPI002284F961|nr:hypothetical protein [Vibrio barjaei]MCY9874025.1 hypothetical protein [Vibrio barjaei]
MSGKKLELSVEGQLAVSLVTSIMAVLVLGTLFATLINVDLAIAVNHSLVGFLPDSFEALKFASDNSEAVQRLQLIFLNIPLLSVVVLYWLSYSMVLLTSDERSLLKTVLMVPGVYCIFYMLGNVGSMMLVV